MRGQKSQNCEIKAFALVESQNESQNACAVINVITDWKMKLSFSNKVSRDLKLPYDICSGIVSSIRPQFSCPHKGPVTDERSNVSHHIDVTSPSYIPAVSVLPWALTSGTGECFNQHSPSLPFATLNQWWNRLEIAPYSERMWSTALSFSLSLSSLSLSLSLSPLSLSLSLSLSALRGI